jgi:hypothetical protein
MSVKHFPAAQSLLECRNRAPLGFFMSKYLASGNSKVQSGGIVDPDRRALPFLYPIRRCQLVNGWYRQIKPRLFGVTNMLLPQACSTSFKILLIEEKPT